MTLVSNILGFFSGLKAKLWIYGSLLLFIVLFILKTYLRGRSDGRDSLKKAISEENEKIRRKWDRIDSTPTDFDDAVTRLRNRVDNSKGS